MSRNAPPETGGISATSSPSESARSRGAYSLLTAYRSPSGSSPSSSAGQTSATRRGLDLPQRPAGALAQAREETHVRQSQVAQRTRTRRAYCRRGGHRSARDRVRDRGEAGLHGGRRRRRRSSRPASSRSRAAPTRTCTAAGRGRSASTRASPRRRSRTSATATCSTRGQTGLSIAFDLPTQLGLRLRRPARARRGRPHRRRDRLARGHGGPARRHPARRGVDVDDDQRARRAAAAALRARRRGAGRARRRRCAAPCRTTSSRSTSRAGTTSSRRGRRCA